MKINRIYQIKDYVLTNGRASIDELCSQFNVSKNTIRRDINILTEQGFIEKVYGGVIAKDSDLRNFETRHIDNKTIKQQIAKTAAQFIKEGDIVYIDSGTTTNTILKHIPEELSFTLLTNSLDVINLAKELPNSDIILIGNSYKRETHSFIESSGSSIISSFNINKAFMAATGLSIHHGASNSDPLEFEIKKKIVQRAEEVYLLVDDSKFDKAALYSYAAINDINYVVTNKEVPKDYQTYFKNNHIQTFLS